MQRTRRSLLVLGTVSVVPLAHAQFTGFKKKKKVDPTRSVKGQVTDEHEEGIRGIVQLKHTRTLEVKSFHTNDNGDYYFHGLDPNVDYELKALAEGRQSRTRTVSSFDSRSELIYNFKLKSEN
ncbi:MAG: carboxypeptidase regulatory-like domain-containing protein [Acidobacteriia bacterium]|nr:carboxypeptidase regulatory-like domain-containing protein [Terriglobia bacterium]